MGQTSRPPQRVRLISVTWLVSCLLVCLNGQKKLSSGVSRTVRVNSSRLRGGFVDRRLREEDFDDQQTSSDHNRAVGYVESRPLILANVEEQEVHNPAVEQAVPEVSQCSAENQCQANARCGHGETVPPQQGGDYHQRHN